MKFKLIRYLLEFLGCFGISYISKYSFLPTILSVILIGWCFNFSTYLRIKNES